MVWLDEHVLHQDRQMTSRGPPCWNVAGPCTSSRPRRIGSTAYPVRSSRHEENFCAASLARLSADTQAQLNALLTAARTPR